MNPPYLRTGIIITLFLASILLSSRLLATPPHVQGREVVLTTDTLCYLRVSVCRSDSVLFQFYHAGRQSRIPLPVSEKSLYLKTDTLAPSFGHLANAMRRYYDRDRNARIEEHQLRTGMDWLTYLPRVYYSGGEQLGVSLDLGGVFRYVRDQRRDEATIQSLNQKSALSYEDALYRLKSMLHDLQARMHDYNRQLEIFFLKERAFRISEQAYRSRELPPAEFLARQIQFEQDKSALTGIEQDIERLTLSIYEHTRYSLPDRP